MVALEGDSFLQQNTWDYLLLRLSMLFDRVQFQKILRESL